jgi:hypothetical protein
MNKRFRIISIIGLIAVVLLAVMAVTRLALQGPTVPKKNLSTSITPGMLYVQGPQIYDGSGHPLLLRGAMIESSFAYLHSWQNGKNPLLVLNASTFHAMTQQWYMNAVRINISQWVYDTNPSVYLTRLDTAVQEANAAGLYVILDFHDNPQSGAQHPYDDGMLHKISLAWWQTMAQHYLNDPMILFDLINEPGYTSWNVWLNGNGGDVVGMKAVIAAIRSTGARQLIVLEPGGAGGGKSPEEGGWASFDPRTISDPSIVYSKHAYDGVIKGNPTIWDQQWGALLHTHPIYYGEWAVLPNSLTISQCKGLTSTNADVITRAFLNYLEQRNANWTAWDFKSFNLIKDASSFAPTSFAMGASWRCGDASAGQAGMGKDVQDYLRTIFNSQVRHTH